MKNELQQIADLLANEYDSKPYHFEVVNAEKITEHDASGKVIFDGWRLVIKPQGAENKSDE